MADDCPIIWRPAALRWSSALLMNRKRQLRSFKTKKKLVSPAVFVNLKPYHKRTTYAVFEGLAHRVFGKTAYLKDMDRIELESFWY